MERSQITLTLAICFLVSACGGGGSSTTEAAESTANNFSSFIATYEDFEAAGGNIVPVNQLPSSAFMTGEMLTETLVTNSFTGIQDDYRVVIGEVTADVNFTAGDITGTVTNIEEFELTDQQSCSVDLSLCQATQVQTLNGSLDLTGNISGSNFTFQSDGRLSGSSNGVGFTADVDIDGNGLFVETNSGQLGAFGLDENGSIEFNNELGSSETTIAQTVLMMHE